MTGVLLIQLGTPDEPTTPALRRYLRQFLSDPRVIETPTTRERWRWQAILNLFILTTRPAQSAAKYRRIWHPENGSPLLYFTKLQTEALQKQLPAIPVRFGMQVGNPPVADVLHEMIGAGVDRLIVLPMYPQYSATTTASATDVLFTALLKERRVPAIRVVPPYYSHPAYLEAVVAIIRAELERMPAPPEKFVFSFHGLPIKYAQRGDPYTTHVKRTTFALVKRLGWKRNQWTQTFQSLFGRDRWLKPYTEQTLIEMAKRGTKRVFLIMPGFTADCLETIDELGNEVTESFKHAGGEELHLCPCLNDHPQWIEAMKTLITEEGQGWL